jgi:hypothetical protein
VTDPFRPLGDQQPPRPPERWERRLNVFGTAFFGVLLLVPGACSILSLPTFRSFAVICLVLSLPLAVMGLLLLRRASRGS